jgi:hypothetical protein
VHIRPSLRISSGHPWCLWVYLANSDAITSLLAVSYACDTRITPWKKPALVACYFP